MTPDRCDAVARVMQSARAGAARALLVERFRSVAFALPVVTDAWERETGEALVGLG